MILRARKPSTRWIAPAAAAGLVIASPAVITSLASAEPTLPPRSAEELVTDVLSTGPVAFSGQVSQHTDLGLPSLSSLGTPDIANPNSLLSLASGTNTWRIWYDGGRSYRVAVVQGQAESDLISNGTVLWAWSSQSRTAVRTQLGGADAAAGNKPALPSSPQNLARQLLANLDKYSAVSTDANQTVAGRAAYELVVTPSDAATRVRDVHIAVDAQTHMPLRVIVHSTQVDQPVVDIAFTQISYSAPNASTFEFTPPPGAQVKQGTAPAQLPGSSNDPAASQPANQPAASGAGTSATQTSGQGWSAVTITRLDASAAAPLLGRITALLPKTSGSWGSGVVLDGPLLSVVLTNDGRVAFGAVSPDALYQALAR